MESFFFHPRMVHLPVALAVLMPVVAAAVALSWWRGWFRARTWSLVVALQALLVVSGIVAFKSGQQQEERVEAVVSHGAVHEHEEAAEAFLWGGSVALVIMLLSLLTSRRRAGLPLATVSVAATLVVFVLGYRTGDAGGDLVYEHGAASAYTGSSDGSGHSSHRSSARAETTDDR